MNLSTVTIMKNAPSKNRVEIKGKLLADLQKLLLKTLVDFAMVCDKYGFYYSLCGGTALGAVRHKGFIPWDDDVDVFMIRAEYDRFLEIFDQELGDKYYIQSLETTPEYGISIAKIMVKDTVFRTHEKPERKDCGVFIDICILENAPNNKLLRTLHGIGCLYFGFCVSCIRFYEDRIVLHELYANVEKKAMKAIEIKILIGRLLRFRSLKKWSLKYSKWNALCKNEKSHYVVCPTGIKHYFGEIFPRDKYCVTTDIEFEGYTFKIIKEYDWALTRLYGDYMTLPPEEKREKHFVLEIKL